MQHQKQKQSYAAVTMQKQTQTQTRQQKRPYAIVDHGSQMAGGTEVNTCFVNSLCGEIRAVTGTEVPADVQRCLVRAMRPAGSAAFMSPLYDGRDATLPRLDDCVLSLCVRYGVRLRVFVDGRPYPYPGQDEDEDEDEDAREAAAVVRLNLVAYRHWVGLRDVLSEEDAAAAAALQAREYAAALQAELEDAAYAAALQAEWEDAAYAAALQARLEREAAAAALQAELEDAAYAAALQAELNGAAPQALEVGA